VPPRIDSSAASFAAQSGSGLAILASRRLAWHDIEGGKRCRGLARASSVAASRIAGFAGGHLNLGPIGPRLNSERRFAADDAKTEPLSGPRHHGPGDGCR